MASITLHKLDKDVDSWFGKGKLPFVGANAEVPEGHKGFNYYDPERVVRDKPMKEWFRFAMAYWHSMRGQLSDPFGGGTAIRPWEGKHDNIENAQNRVRVCFRLMEKLGLKHYCFHDTDLIPGFKDWVTYEKHLQAIMPVLKDEQARTGITPLWVTANLFSNPVYLHGAATGTDPKVFASAALQVKTAMEMGKELGAKGYVFWGGREGYASIYNTDLERELSNAARFFNMALEHADDIGFKGNFYIEPKPKEPTTHQYGHDVEAQIAFLASFSNPATMARLGFNQNLLDRLGFNLEGNHVTLAGHHERHDVRFASLHKKWASFDANQGDPLTGWDVDEFPTSRAIALDILEVLIAQGGFATGGFNFDAKPRRESFNPMDLVTGHAGGMDTYAFALLAADKLLQHPRYQQLVQQRYAEWEGMLGQEIASGTHSLSSLADLVKNQKMPQQKKSGGYEEIKFIREEVLIQTGIEESRRTS